MPEQIARCRLGGFVHFGHKGKGFCPKGVLSIYQIGQPSRPKLRVLPMA